MVKQERRARERDRGRRGAMCDYTTTIMIYSSTDVCSLLMLGFQYVVMEWQNGPPI